MFRGGLRGGLRAVSPVRVLSPLAVVALIAAVIVVTTAGGSSPRLGRGVSLPLPVPSATTTTSVQPPPTTTSTSTAASSSAARTSAPPSTVSSAQRQLPQAQSSVASPSRVTRPTSSTTPSYVQALPVVAFIGDSFTAGAGASSYATQWTSLVSRYYGWDQRNFGVGGSGYVTSGHDNGATNYLGRVAEVAAQEPSFVIVSGGLNDIATSTDDQFVAAVNQTYAALRQALPHATIVGITPFYDAQTPPDRLAAMAAEVRSAVQAVGGTYLDIGDPLLDQPQDISADGVHPNDSGYAALAQAIEAAYGPRS